MIPTQKIGSTTLAKGGTLSTRKHRFESFTQRIAKLNIDPIRRSRRLDLETSHLTDTASHLRTGLDQWKELNLSENFTNFVRDLRPLCDSLPQVLYYHEDIMALLAKYIEKGNSLSLEPLLDLLARFAHDLSIRFESHFSKAVTLVANLASKHVDVEVIEWSFTCLAWLFKYLSRLLVPDLRPLFQVMAPLLGKELQKGHITRFAAEALSFLLRKAALAYHKNEKPLTNIIECILVEIDSTEQETNRAQLYYHGIMTLLISAIKGIDRKIHSGGGSVYRCLLNCITERSLGNSAKAERIVCGLTIGLIHHTDAATFTPILDIIFENIQKQERNMNGCHTDMFCRLLFIAVTVRKASRIQDWSPLFDALITLSKTCENHPHESISQVFETAAVILQSSPMAIFDLRLRPVIDFITSERNAEHFIPFCNYFCDLGRERFESLILPYFREYVKQSLLEVRMLTASQIYCLSLGDEGVSIASAGT